MYYYLATTEKDGEKNLQVVDANGKVKLDAKEKKVDNPKDFILLALKELELPEISTDLILKYLVPPPEEEIPTEEETKTSEPEKPSSETPGPTEMGGGNVPRMPESIQKLKEKFG